MSSIDWANDSAATIRTQLLTVVETRLPMSEARVTGAMGVKTFGPGAEGWDGMAAKLREMGWNETANQLVNGYDYGDPAMQAMLDQLGQIDPVIFTAERVATMKAWGVTRSPMWASEGFDAEPTLEQVTARKSREIAIASTAARINAASEARRAAVDNASSTGAEIIAATEEAFA